jgi:F0F1-type ATP synthase assembly protein I
MIWLWGLTVGLLLGTILGVVLARRPHRQRDQRSRGGTAALARVADSLEREVRRRPV